MHRPYKKILLTSLLISLFILLSFPQPARASTFLVNTLDDLNDGQCDLTHCSLREAIYAANDNPGPDIIEFDVPDGGSNIIRLTAPLPALIDDATTIDATTLPYYTGYPEIFLGIDDGVVAVERGLWITSNDNVIRGLGLAGFGIHPAELNELDGAIIVTGTGNLIEDNAIGLGGVWTSFGVRLAEQENSVINNIISGNDYAGIVVMAPNNVIQGNIIGTDVAGTAANPNGVGIVLLSGADHTLVGGIQTGMGNLISGNTHSGIRCHSDDNEFYGNHIGVDSSGSVALPNTNYGILVYGSNNHIGGGDPGQGNVISGNSYDGISVHGETNFIQGNHIGTDSSGTVHVPNVSDGIQVSDAANIIIGGTTTNLGNVIMGNGRDGIALYHFPHDTFIANNIIAENGDEGISLGYVTSANTFTQNSIYANGGLGIETKGWNDGIEPPVLTSSLWSAITGTACPGCLIEFFLADPDPSGFGEGRTYLDLGYADSNGQFSFTVDGIGFCQLVTATATETTDFNTSGFAQNIFANCIQFESLFLYPAWIFTIVAFGVLTWIVRRRRPAPGRSILFGAVGGGLLFLVLIMALPFVRPEFTNPPECGNGIVEGGETCDGDDLSLCRDDQVCENCRCVTVIEEPVCGNGVLDEGEQCDGDDRTLCRDDQVCENCRCVTPMEAEPPSEGCFYEALSSTYCRVSDYRESDPVAIVSAGESALLVGLNPEYTHGLFELESGDRCWMWFNTLDGPENPLGTCGVQQVNPPEPPEEIECRIDMNEAECSAAGGEWTAGAGCMCP